MTRRLLACSVLALVISCTTGRPAQQEAEAPATSPGDWNLDTDALVDRAETLRDRSFDSPPSFVVEPFDSSTGHASSLSRSALREGRWIADYLFGLEELDKPPKQVELLADSARADRAARYLPDRHVVQLDAETSAEPDEMRRDVLFALVSGLDHTNHDSLILSDIPGWDASLAIRAVKAGPAAFVTTAALASERELSDPLNKVADYPELFDRLRSDESGAGSAAERPRPAGAIDSIDALDRRLRRYSTRQGFALTAALFRSGRWSAAELPFSTPPASSADVVRPDRWMKARPTAEWTWPETDEKILERGTVGPITTVVWLEQTIPSPFAATLFNGYESDSFRVVGADGNDARRFEWISMWDTPASARQVAAAFDRVFRRTTPDERRHSVVQGGLKVAVVATAGELSNPPKMLQNRDTGTEDVGVDTASTEPANRTDAGPARDAATEESNTNTSGSAIDRYARQLLEAKARFVPRDGLPVNFVPSRRDAYRSQARQATFDKETWRDPATGIEIGLNSLAKWKTRASNSLPLRWLARSPSGAVLQWSTTLQTPLDPPFGEDAYRARLRKRLGSAERESGTELEFTDSKLAPVSIAIRGPNKDHPRALIWQYRCSDAIHTASLGLSNTSNPDDDRAAVTALLEKATDDRGRLLGCENVVEDETDSSDAEGTIDVEMHGE